jgi:ribonuclease-3
MKPSNLPKNLVMKNQPASLAVFWEEFMTLEFKNKELFALAFTHRSASKKSNERLEFLGDSILSFIVSKHLYETFPKKSEGALTMLRSLLVKKKTLAIVSTHLGFGKLLILSKSEEDSGGRTNESILSDCFESYLAGLFIDQGLVAAEEFVAKHILPLISEVEERQDLKDYKSILQEKIQSEGHPSPTYKIIKEEGPDHAKTFTAEALDLERKLGEGHGRTKQEAEIDAAKTALDTINSK